MCDQKFNHANEQKTHSANSVEMNKKNRFEVVVTSYGRQILTKQIKNQEKANNSLSYHFAAIKKKLSNGQKHG